MLNNFISEFNLITSVKLNKNREILNKTFCSKLGNRPTRHSNRISKRERPQAKRNLPARGRPRAELEPHGDNRLVVAQGRLQGAHHQRLSKSALGDALSERQAHEVLQRLAEAQFEPIMILHHTYYTYLT